MAEIASPSSAPPPRQPLLPAIPYHYLPAARASLHEARLHSRHSALLFAIMASISGFCTGYNLYVAGGVSTMTDFLSTFFPSIAKAIASDKELQQQQMNVGGGGGRGGSSSYCLFNTPVLSFFNSSYLLSAMVTTTLLTFLLTGRYGRRQSLLWGGVCFTLGAVLCAGAMNITMLMLGRGVLGVGMAFSVTTVPIYISEIAPETRRGSLTMLFPLMIYIGGLSACVLNYKSPNWRWSLGFAQIPAGCAVVLLSWFLPESPSIASMTERGEVLQQLQRHADLAISVSQRIQMIRSRSMSRSGSLRSLQQRPWLRIMQRAYWPQLIVAIAMPLFQQLTGKTAITYYAPMIFTTLVIEEAEGMAILCVAMSVIGTVVAVCIVDIVGRRSLFFTGGLVMFVSQMVIGAILLAAGGLTPTIPIQVLFVLSIMTFILSYGFSWGPLGWLVPSEIFSMEMRPTGEALAANVSSFFSFILAQWFLPIFCTFQYGIFFSFGFCILIMTVFVYFLLPEMKDIHIEEAEEVWRQHPLWRRFYM